MLRWRFPALLYLSPIVAWPPFGLTQGKDGAPRNTDKFVTVYGAKIHYVEAGSGAPLILVHGLADDTTSGIP